MNALLLELQMVSGSAPGLVLPELAERLVGQLREVELCRWVGVWTRAGPGSADCCGLAQIAERASCTTQPESGCVT